MRLPCSEARNRFWILLRCVFSMTSMTSAHVTSSEVRGLSASLFVPADATSMSGLDAKTCSAVGLRRRSGYIRTGRFSMEPGLGGTVCEARSRGDRDEASTGRWASFRHNRLTVVASGSTILLAKHHEMR